MGAARTAGRRCLASWALSLHGPRGGVHSPISDLAVPRGTVWTDGGNMPVGSLADCLLGPHPSILRTVHSEQSRLHRELSVFWPENSHRRALCFDHILSAPWCWGGEACWCRPLEKVGVTIGAPISVSRHRESLMHIWLTYATPHPCVWSPRSTRLSSTLRAPRR